MIDIGAFVTKILDKLPIVELWQTRTSARFEHDKKKFDELDKLISEVTLESILDEAYRQRVERSSLEPISRYLEWEKLSSNQFLINKIRQSQLSFNARLRIFRDCLSANLFTVDDDPGYLHFRPDQNPSRGRTAEEDRKLFEDRVIELDHTITQCETAYRTFRATIKKHLYV